jgi:hypothetical protein
MSFCANCGGQLNEGMAFCNNCGNRIEGASANQITHEMYEQFSGFGLGAKSFVITANSLIYGDVAYPYAQLSPININTAPTAITNGVATAITADGQTLTLAYAANQNERLLKAITYANEQIDIVHGNTKNHKYVMQASTGAKLEVYDDYLMFYDMSTSATGIMGKASEKVGGVGGGLGKGFGKLISTVGSVGASVGNITRGGSTGVIIMFVDLTALQLNADSLIFNEHSIPVSYENMGLAKEIVTYIEETRSVEKSEPQALPEDQGLWEQIKGTARTFPLSGSVLEISGSMDIFNSYRLKFREIASRYADKAEKAYKSKVHDFVTFMEFFPKIYLDNLELIAKRATDILIAEDVWSVTYDEFMLMHIGEYHLALDDYNTMAESVELTVQANQERTAGIMSFIPHVSGFGFGIKGALKGIATAEAFNIVRDGIENAAMKNTANVNPAQQQELYARVNPDVLLYNVYADYFNVFLTLVKVLGASGQDIWLPSDESYSSATSVFKNLSNPNFPQAKVTGAFIEILKIMPYDADYYKWAISKFEGAEEVAAIKNYFGYTDFNNPRIV